MTRARLRPGRKPRVANQGQRVSLGLKVTPEIKNKLDAAAKENGRTQSQEAESRIEQTFRSQDYLDQAMELAYGPRLAVLLAVMGRAMKEIGQYNAAFPNNWLDQPHLFDETYCVVKEALDAFRPEKDRPPRDAIIAPMIIRTLLHAVKDPDKAGELKSWGAPLHAKMGTAAARLRIDPFVQVIEASAEGLRVRYREDK
jgi:TraY domain-containing protein